MDVTADDCMDAGGRATPGAVADDGVRHSLWPVRDLQGWSGADCGLRYPGAALRRRRPPPFGRRVRRVAAARRTCHPRHTGEEAYNYFLAVIFPDNQMQILDYNRAVKDLQGLATEVFLRKLDGSFMRSEDAAAQNRRTPASSECI